MKDYYTVWFTNFVGCALGISDISWGITVSATSESEALEIGMKEARTLNREFGMPPHNIRVSEAELRQMATVQRMLDA